MAMPGSFMLVLLFLLGMSGGCKGQVTTPPVVQGGDTTQVANKAMPSPPPILNKPNRGRITFDQDIETSKYFFIFHDANGKEVQRISQQEMGDLGEFRNLPFPKIIEENQLKGYDLRRLTPEQKQSKLNILHLQSISPMKIARTHWIFYGTGGGLQDGLNYSGNYLILMSALTGVDSTSETPTFTKSVIKVLDSSGKQIAKVEQDHEIGAMCISDDARFLFMGVEDIHLDPSESYSTRRPSSLYDLKEKTQYLLPVAFDVNTVISSDHLRFQKGQYFSFDLRDQSRLHVLVDPYNKVIYTKQYSEEYSDFSNPDLSTYSKKTFK